MAKYYAIATNKENQSIRINFDILDKQPQTRHEAESIAKAYSKKQGLTYSNTYVVQGTQKQPSTITKFKAHRKQHGHNGKNWAKAL